MPNIELPDLAHDQFGLLTWVIIGVVAIAVAVVFCLIKLAQARQSSVDGNLTLLAKAVAILRKLARLILARTSKILAIVERMSTTVDRMERDIRDIRRDIDDLRDRL